jgi:hypothetical protein
MASVRIQKCRIGVEPRKIKKVSLSLFIKKVLLFKISGLKVSLFKISRLNENLLALNFSIITNIHETFQSSNQVEIP